MPIYEYACQQCGHHLEAFQKISEPALETCPACGASKLQRLVSAPAFQLKGSGWYATDYKDKPKSKDESTKATENKADKPADSDKKE